MPRFLNLKNFGSGHNCFYYKKDKIKITSFMLYDNQYITELFESESEQNRIYKLVQKEAELNEIENNK